MQMRRTSERHCSQEPRDCRGRRAQQISLPRSATFPLPEKGRPDKTIIGVAWCLGNFGDHEKDQRRPLLYTGRCQILQSPERTRISRIRVIFLSTNMCRLRGMRGRARRAARCPISACKLCSRFALSPTRQCSLAGEPNAVYVHCADARRTR